MKRILIVDDEEMIVRTVKAYLDQDGFKTYTAYDGEEALRAFNEKGPDLIILDLMLPKMSGIEVAKKIRATSTVPIIMLTAKAGASHSERPRPSWPTRNSSRARMSAGREARFAMTGSSGSASLLCSA